VREVELNQDMRSVNNLLDFLEKVRACVRACGEAAGRPGRALLSCYLACCPALPLAQVFNGGSDFNEPVKRCLDRLTDARWANSDILLVSDGELRQPAQEVCRGGAPACLPACLLSGGKC
jgi:hypothetical protein